MNGTKDTRNSFNGFGEFTYIKKGVFGKPITSFYGLGIEIQECKQLSILNFFIENRDEAQCIGEQLPNIIIALGKIATDKDCWNNALAEELLQGIARSYLDGEDIEEENALSAVEAITCSVNCLTLVELAVQNEWPYDEVVETAISKVDDMDELLNLIALSEQDGIRNAIKDRIMVLKGVTHEL